MCGIAGQVLFKNHAGNQGLNIAWINEVGIIQSHRGPDEINIWLGENVALAIKDCQLLIYQAPQGSQ